MEKAKNSPEINAKFKSNGIEILGSVPPEASRVLTPEALKFVADLERKFGSKRLKLLDQRQKIQKKIDGGQFPSFLTETEKIRNSPWTVAPVPEELLSRCVEITGPVDRKMIINALNSGANVFMADFEDSQSPVWKLMIQGQFNLMDAVRKTIEFTNPQGKKYALNPQTAKLFVRPRGWHLPEDHMKVDGKSISGSLFDFGLYFFHNATELIKRKTGPYFYLPKLESHLEARLWNEVFTYSEKVLKVPHGTIKATVLIETILAVYEMDEILYELKDHSAGLNCGRWDYIFSVIKKFSNHPDFVFPDRSMVTMDKHFLNSYVDLLIQTCHKRGVHAMGGMAAQIPIKNDAQANEQALAKVRADKIREAKAGHDGTWVAHPGLIEVARSAFKEFMKGPNQLNIKREEVQVSEKDLIQIPDGKITEKGLRTNVNVGILYFEAWLGGNGCVPLYNLMEDAATCEISRAQIWQWIRHPKGILDDGRKVTKELFREILAEELQKIKNSAQENKGALPNLDMAAQLFDKIITQSQFASFLTLEAYAHLDKSAEGTC